MSQCNVWFWKDSEEKWKNSVCEHIQAETPCESEIVLLNCNGAITFEGSFPLIYYLFDICLKLKIFSDKKLMFLNSKDFHEAVKLCIERLKNKENINDNEKNEDSVLNCMSSYINSLKSDENETENKSVSCLKEFISESNCIEIWHMLKIIRSYKKESNEFSDYLSKRKFVLLGSVETEILREIVTILGNGQVYYITVETPLNNSIEASPSGETRTIISPTKINFSSELQDVNNIFINTEIKNLGSATKEYVEEIITAFLQLLVNSRNELALSKVMISPFINLTHEAFTHLKHLSMEKAMPMCQTCISYVMKIRLGGKGYAPPANCPLLLHLKSLELFVDTLNQMQTIIEEENVSKLAVKRLITLLKKKLIKCGSSKLKPVIIETTVENLLSVVEKVLSLTETKHCKTDAPQICQETLDVLYLVVNYINCSYWIASPKNLLKQSHCKRTPINLPPLIGYFRSPEEELSSKEVITEENSMNSDTSSLGFPAPLMSYFHHSDNSCSVSSTCTKYETPTRTSFESVIYAEDSLVENEFTDKGNSSLKCKKRPALGDITNDKSIEAGKKSQKMSTITPIKAKQITKVKENKIRTKEVKKEIRKTKLCKKFKQIEGQGKITNFFVTNKK